MSLFLALLRLHQEQCLQLWSSQYKTATETVERVQQSHQDNSEAAALIHKKLRELSLHSLGNSRWRWELIAASNCLIRGCREGGTKLLAVLRSDMTRGDGHKLKHGKFQFNIKKKNHLDGSKTLGQVAEKLCGITILGDIPAWLEMALCNAV